MKLPKLKPITIIVLIVTFFIIVGLLAAIAALSAKKGKTPNDGDVPLAQNSTNSVPTTSSFPSDELENSITNSTPRGGDDDSNNAFEDYFDSEDLITYFENSTVNDMVAYSAAGANMEKLKKDFKLSSFYSEEIKDDDLEELVKLLKKALVEKNLEQVDIEEADNLFANKFIIVDNIFYFGICADYIYSFSGDSIDIFKISGKLSEFATEMPEEIETDFDTFLFTYEEREAQINFDDEGIVNDLKEILFSYEVEDVSTDDLEYVGEIEFDNDKTLNIFLEDEYALGEYKSGKKTYTLMINKDFVTSIIDITENALN